MIPRIDFEKIMADEHHSLNALRNAVTVSGFFIVFNTPIKEKEVLKTLNAYREFFLLPSEVKEKVSMARTGSNRGWGNTQAEQVNPNYNPDFKEVFDNGLEIPRDNPLSKLSVYSQNIWPKEPERFSEIILSYYNNAMILSKEILRKISNVIGQDQTYFEDKFEMPMALLRGNFYPERPKWAGEKDYGIASHTDYGCLTLLANDGTPGLEVLNLNKQWTPVNFKPGEFVINFGEMLQMWSSEQIKATPHRVKGSSAQRISIPLFFNPSYHTDISPKNSEREIIAGEYLTNRYNETYVHLQGQEKI